MRGLLGRQRDPRVAPGERSPGAGRLQSPLHAPGARGGGRRDRFAATTSRRSNSTPRPTIRWFWGRRRALGREFPWAAGGPGARFPGDRAHHAAGHRRAPGRATGESRSLPGTARLPDRGSRTLLRVHDGPDHCRVAGRGVAESLAIRRASARSQPMRTRRISSPWGWRRHSRPAGSWRTPNASSAAELLCAAQGLEFLRPLRPGRGVERLHQRMRTPGDAESPLLEADRPPAPDLERLARPRSTTATWIPPPVWLARPPGRSYLPMPDSLAFVPVPLAAA